MKEARRRGNDQPGRPERMVWDLQNSGGEGGLGQERGRDPVLQGVELSRERGLKEGRILW